MTTNYLRTAILLAGLTALFVTLAFPETPLWLELVLVALAALGFYAIAGSPYWRIVYRESPLRRAAWRYRP